MNGGWKQSELQNHPDLCTLGVPQLSARTLTKELFRIGENLVSNEVISGPRVDTEKEREREGERRGEKDNR